ncbi:G-type lectin S-receptor-like serine/threonine-protein kinase At1g34300 [Dendrobium catenatum]|uniref:non-specific serine/threonine protein kinase n=1 Tax=Dendrobium catenatum TaxID=906689 RepID=A0A2I0VY27_9ASPA|nr:G-type lectin S-receptor-like serine/threonine-protein kinase At1g34300 [Dendrobium catenatum]PKU68325.1 G-type lectin S-receptor-like serine/threonine-protein kinase [Dendrobium catenatum]
MGRRWAQLPNISEEAEGTARRGRILMAALALLLLLPVSGQSREQSNTSSFSISDPPWLPSQNNRTLRSPNSLFSAGFLSSGSNISLFEFTVWVEASVDKTRVWAIGPVPSSSSLFISDAGDLTLVGLSGMNLFPSGASGAPNSTFLQLNDNGSLTFRNWTSFSSPVDTLLPNQLLPINTSLSSGDYRFDGSSLWFHSQMFWSIQPISYIKSDGGLIADPTNGANSYIASDFGQNSTLRRLTINADGNLRLYSLERNSGGHWKIVWFAMYEVCMIPNRCGPNSICVPNGSYDTNKCVCAPGFRMSTTDEGCVRKKDYLPSSKFLPLEYISFTGKQGTVDLSPADIDRCRFTCIENSSCTGFSYILNGTQICYNHYGELVNGYWSTSSHITMFLRVAISETDTSNFTGLTSIIDTACPLLISLPLPPKEVKTLARNVSIIVMLLVLELLVGGLCFLGFLRRYSKYRDMARRLGLELLPAGGPKRFSYSELRAATADFSKVLGSGGYGVVYHGQLPDGRTVAVKQLRKSSGGDAEFWAEVTIIARMHHLNLVRIWGFCTEKEKRLLVYEYIPNGSLDKFLFQDLTEFSGTDEESRSYSRITGKPRPILDLNIRYRIALGVARAIAYLHEECLEWVLHCDIKPENILLDDNFCPKVSDFGLSKLTNKEERVSMSRIRGTRGYMAPEWVMNEEPITAKADVYSFGVVLLELVAGMRCWDFRRDSVDSEDWYFPRWAYDKVFVERKVEDILDARILGSFDDRIKVKMVERMVKTAMLCMQDRAEARPSMGKVAKMLEGSVELNEPAKPIIFYLEGGI